MRHLFAILLCLGMLACDDGALPDAPEPALLPSPPPVVLVAEAGPPEAAASAPTWGYVIVLSPTVGAEVEAAVLRAARAWELRTMGALRFEILPRTAKTPPCTDALIGIDQLPGEPGDDEETALGSHALRTCHDVAIRYPWASEAVFKTTYDRLGVSPLVLVASHEIGHVLGLGHASPEERSVMAPTVRLSPVAKPTCGDAAALGFLRATPVRCFEEREETAP